MKRAPSKFNLNKSRSKSDDKILRSIWCSLSVSQCFCLMLMAKSAAIWYILTQMPSTDGLAASHRWGPHCSFRYERRFCNGRINRDTKKSNTTNVYFVQHSNLVHHDIDAFHRWLGCLTQERTTLFPSGTKDVSVMEGSHFPPKKCHNFDLF